MIRKKILLLGDFHVGKTSLIRRYVDNSFDDNYLTTIGVKISRKQIVTEHESCELLIWDIEGATPQKRIPKSYFKGASGAIFVADVSREETIKNLEEHIKDFLSVNPDAVYLTAYNKADMLTHEQQDAYILDDASFLTSAKENQNVSLLFETLTKRMLE